MVNGAMWLIPANEIWARMWTQSGAFNYQCETRVLSAFALHGLQADPPRSVRENPPLLFQATAVQGVIRYCSINSYCLTNRSLLKGHTGGTYRLDVYVTETGTRWQGQMKTLYTTKQEEGELCLEGFAFAIKKCSFLKRGCLIHPLQALDTLP